MVFCTQVFNIQCFVSESKHIIQNSDVPRGWLANELFYSHRVRIRSATHTMQPRNRHTPWPPFSQRTRPPRRSAGIEISRTVLHSISCNTEKLFAWFLPFAPTTDQLFATVNMRHAQGNPGVGTTVMQQFSRGERPWNIFTSHQRPAWHLCNAFLLFCRTRSHHRYTAS
jgi:hypothetical protein